MATYPIAVKVTTDEVENFMGDGTMTTTEFNESFLTTWSTRVIALGKGADRPEVVYLAGPYRPYVDDEGQRHTIAQNVREAGQLGIELWKRGYVALVPHTLTYLSPAQQRQDGGIAGVDPQIFMDGELELVRRSDILVLMPHWKVSKGARVERTYAQKIGIPVYEWEEFLALDDEKKGAA